MPDRATSAAATAGPTTHIQSARVEYGYPHGHAGHLTAEEEATLQNFKVFLQEKGLYKPGPPAPSHDDPTLLRFLRARKWVVADAYAQFSDTEAWRNATKLDALYDTIDVEAYEESRRLYPQWTGRRDKRGIPLYLFEIRHLDSKTIAKYEKSLDGDKAAGDGKTPAKLVRLFALYENLTRFAQPLCTHLTDREHARTPITLSTNIVDIGGVSLKQFWNLKGHMQAASQLATAHYPETLDRIFVIGAPSFFSTVWGWVKRWFDPNTVAKIFILSPHEVLPVLSGLIDKQNIPKQYGGELEFNWGDDPNLDALIRSTASWEAGHTNFPKGPMYWVPADGGKKVECVAVGSVGKKQRRENVCTLPVPFHMEAERALNGQVVETAPAASAAPETKATEAAPATETPTDIPATDSATKAAEPTPVGTDGTPLTTAPIASAAPVASAPVASAPEKATEEEVFADAKEVVSPPVATSATPAFKDLSLEDNVKIDEKTADATETVPNGKPVAAA